MLCNKYIYITGVGSGVGVWVCGCVCVCGGGGGVETRGACAPSFVMGGGGQWYVSGPPHFYFPLELYVYITLTNNYLAFFIYQLIILWTISIN